MRSQLPILSAFLLLFLTACSTPEQADPTLEYFITRDLSFLSEGLPSEGAKAWPGNGCREFEIKLKIAFLGEIKTTMQHCCVEYVCNAVAINEVLDFFLGDNKSYGSLKVEVVSSGMFRLNRYDIRVRPGEYSLDPKTGHLQGLQYEVWIKR